MVSFILNGKMNLIIIGNGSQMPYMLIDKR